MYRLSRFFVSDIVAGENILRNGYFPIFNGTERSDHGIIVAANGSCKTTLLSFLFTVFTPDRRRFVQYLQSGGDKTLEQYLVPGRPAVVLLNLSINLDATLFETSPRETLVLGQLLYRHRRAPDKIDRSYFTADSQAFFDGLCQEWEGLSRQSHPYTAARAFLSDKVLQTGSQKEWEDRLESLGLDPWLVNRQVDFSRSEGGIKDSFKFKSEAEFLSFFLGCVSDLDSAMGLRDNTAQTLGKMRNRPEKKKQLGAVLSLKQNLETFHHMGRAWHIAHEAIEDYQFQLGEAVHLLTAAKIEADTALGESELAVLNNHNRQKQVQTARETAQANQVRVEAARHAREVRELKQRVVEADGQLAEYQAEQSALKAAAYLACLARFRAEAESKEKILTSRDSLLTPAQKQVGLRAVQYHVRLDSLRTEVSSEIAAMDEAATAAVKKQHCLEGTLGKLRREVLTLNSDLSRLTAQVRAAHMARENLGLAPGDAPRDVREGLETKIHACGDTLGRITTRLQEIEGHQGQAEVRWQELHRSCIQGEEALKQARGLGAREKVERELLLGDANLKTIAGSATFEPTRADLATRLGESMARTRTRTEGLQEQLLEVVNQLKHLEHMDTLLVDDQVVRLIAHYMARGLSPEDLKPFPDYISGLDWRLEEIARVVEGDPGRFTGIMAVSEAVIRKVQKIPAPDWLHRPVVISTPLDLERTGDLNFSVIAPCDPIVYSKTFLEDQKKQLGKKQAKLREQVADRISRLRSLEVSARHLDDYRKKYPDGAAVGLLSRNVDLAGENLVRIQSDIQSLETETKTHGARKKELEDRFQKETGTLARLEQLLRQVDLWLAQYGDMDAWEASVARKEVQRVEVDSALIQVQAEEKTTGETLTRLYGTMAEKKAALKNLDDRSDDIPATEGVCLTEDQHQQALSMDLSTLRRQHEEAQNDVIRIASELGIDGLRNELQRVQEKIQKNANALEQYRSTTPFDGKIAENWAGKSSRDRDDRIAALSVTLGELKEGRAGHRARLEGRERDLARCEKTLKQLADQGIHGDIDLDKLDHTDPDGLIRHYGKVAQTQEATLNELRNHTERQTALLEKNRLWKNEIKLALATVSGHAPCWDSLSPRGDWVELVRVENPVESAVIFRQRLEEILNSRNERDVHMAASRKNMGRAFDRLQGELRDERLKQQLPAIVDELSRHDAETLGAQSAEFIEKCSHIAANIEGDLSRSAQFVESLVDQLFQHVRVSHQKLLNASKQLMPENVFVYGGKAILKAGTRLDFTRNAAVYRKSMDNWLDELIQANRMPEVNARVGDTLGTELLYRLLKVSSAKQEFGIRLLKCDDTGRNYEPVGKDLGSGGEALTTAVLLYSLLTSMRQKRRNKKEDRIPAFLIADNPLGVCNRSDFLDTQLKVARAMGIQCVYFTGINDRESLGLFQHRVAIRQSGRQIQVGGKPYNCLEVIEQNVAELE